MVVLALIYDVFLSVHYYSTIFIVVLVCFHFMAAVFHKFYLKDQYGVWKRMSFNKSLENKFKQKIKL